MRIAPFPILGLLLLAECAHAQMQPESPGTVILPEPTPAWLMVKSQQGAYIFDGDSGEMQGMISNETGIYTPAIVTVPARKEAYMVESFYSRAVRGERSDVLSIIDMTNLTIKAEIDIPDRAAALGFRNHIGVMGDDRHVVLFNQTPAQSVSVLDVVDRQFDAEIATPGCAVIMPTGERAFMMICGDGRLQLIELDENGHEAGRSQTERFFSVDDDAVFDMPMKTRDGWVLVSRNALVYEVSVSGSKISVAKPWPMQPEDKAAAKDAKKTWRPGGKQVFAIDRESGLLYALMHEGEVDTHGEFGTEVWVIDLARKRRVGTLELEVPASHILSSQESVPKLYVYDDKKKLDIYDGHRLRLLRSIAEPGPDPWLLQTLSQYD